MTSVSAESPFSLSGRLAVVTGARRGIGLAFAEALAAAGADIVGVSASLEADGGEVGERVRELGRRFWAMPADLGDRAAVGRLLDDLGALGRPVDILVNNAGTIHRTPASDHQVEDWDRVLEVNLSAPFRLAQALGASMVGRGEGKIIFTASLLSFRAASPCRDTRRPSTRSPAS